MNNARIFNNSVTLPLKFILTFIEKRNHTRRTMETIKPTQFLGIWMDHSTAHLMEYTRDSMETETVESTFTHQDREETLNRSESVMHNKEQQKQRLYYKELGEIIRKYDEVVLFGPTDAKAELFNILKEDHLFDNINIGVEDADKMTENQQHAFVKWYFSKHFTN